MHKGIFLFDTSPLLTLATPIIDKRPAIDYVLPHLKMGVVATVANEATVNPSYRDSAIIQTLLNAGSIIQIPVSASPVDHLINAYNLGGGKGQGERDTIRMAITMGARVVIDDQAAFFIAARFETRPIMLLDVIVELARSHDLTKPFSQKLVTSISQTGRYTTASIQHTVHKLNEVIET
jgi:hypothetical protein